MHTKDKLNKLRDLLGVSIAKMADETGVPAGTLSTYFSGKSQSMSYESFMRILVRYGICSNRFFEAEDIQTLDDVRIHSPADAAASGASETNAKHAHLIQGKPRVIIADMEEQTANAARKAIKEVFDDQAFRTMHANVIWWRGIACSLMAAITVGLIVVLIINLTR